MDPLLLSLNQHQKAYKLFQKGLHKPNSDDSRNVSAMKDDFPKSMLEKRHNLEGGMEKRNKDFSRKRNEHFTELRNLPKKETDHFKEIKPRKSGYLPAITTPISTSERFSAQMEDGSRNVLNLSQKLDSWKSPLPNLQNDTDEFIAAIRNTLPASVARFNRLRQEFEEEQLKKIKPYGGEWGPQSYQPWQMMDYYMVRPLVEELVDRVLESVSTTQIPGTMSLQTMLATPLKDRFLRSVLVDAKVLLPIVEEIILEETEEFCRNICEEMLKLETCVKDRWESKFMQIILNASLQGCEVTSASYESFMKNLSNQFHSLENKNKHRAKVWSHSQHLHLEPWKQHKAKELTRSSDDLINLEFDLLIPNDIMEENNYTSSEDDVKWHKNMVSYHSREMEYWSSMSLNVLVLPLSNDYSAICASKTSFNRRYVAFGTTHGDLFVIDFKWTPPRSIRFWIGTDDGDLIRDISWSLNSQTIATITQKGILTIYSLQSGKSMKTKPVEKATANPIEPSSDRYSPEELHPLFKLDPAIQDFKFYTGPLAESGSHNNPMQPVLTAFHPSLTLLGSQPSICVAVDNVDIIKCDLSDQFLYSAEDEDEDEESGDKQLLSPAVYQAKVLPSSGRMNVIGSDVKAELFRQHKHPILILGFIGNCRDMVTVDSEGYINIWKYAREFLTKEEIFKPSRRYRLKLTKTQYVPSGHPQVVFDDHTNEKILSRPEMEQERNRAEYQMSTVMQNLELWIHRFSDDRKMRTFIYMPVEGVRSAGAPFHTVNRHNGTRLLSSYLVQVYQPRLVTCSKLLQCKLSPSGKQLVFLLLFPQLSPKEAHVTCVVLDLCEIRLKNFRRDVVLTDASFHDRCLTEDIVSCDITEPVGVTGSQYLFLIIDGQMFGYSVTTGQTIFMSTTNENLNGFCGCWIPQEQLNLSSHSKFTVSSTTGKLYVSVYSSKLNSANPLTILQLVDGSSELKRKLLRHSLTLWHGSTALPPSEQRLDRERWKTSALTNQKHVKVLVREILESIVESVLVQKTGNLTPLSSPAETQRKRAQYYADFEDQIEFSMKL